MKKYIALILAVVLILSLSFGALAEDGGASSESVLDEMKTEIDTFEAAHPEMKDAFHLIIKDTANIAVEEFREAFIQIQSRFAEMLEADRQQMDLPEEAQESMQERLQTQAVLVNLSFIAYLKSSEERMIATLRGQEYPEGEADLIATLKKISAESEGTGNAYNATLKAEIDRVLETLEKDYNNDLGAWYAEVSARPELPPDATAKVDGESHPPMPPEGEEKPDADAPKEGERPIPFNDHFKVIHGELEAAAGRIDERIQALAKEAAGKYQVAEDAAAEAFDLLNRLMVLVNDQMMKLLENLDKDTIANLMTAK